MKNEDAAVLGSTVFAARLVQLHDAAASAPTLAYVQNQTNGWI